MPNVNIFHGCGHLARDVELRTSKSGLQIASFCVGISSSEKVNGEWTKTVEWVNGVCFGKPAEWLSEAKKGDVCIFSGRLKTSSWEDKEGVKRYKTEVICNDVQSIKKNKTNGEKGDTFVEDFANGELDDEIPF